MDGKLLTSSIVHLKGQELRMIYSLLFKTNIVSLMSAKTKDLFNKNVDHFNASLEKEIEKLAHISDEALQIDLFLKLTEIYELKGSLYDSAHEIEQKCAQIIQSAHEEMLKDEKEYKEFVHSADDKSALQFMIHYQMQKVFSTFDGKFKEFNEKERNDFTEKIHQFLMELPTEKQAQLKEKLQIDELTNDTVRQIMVTQGSVTVLSIIVEVAGFTAYTSLTSAIATSMAIVGMTRPFGVYTFATTLLTLIINPFVLIPLALGGGGWLLTRQNKHLRKKLVPVVLLQMTLPLIVGVGHEEAEQQNLQAFISRWQHQREKQNELNTQQHRLLKEIAFNEKNARTLEKKASEISKDVTHLISEMEHLHRSFKQMLYSIQSDEQSTLYTSLLEISASKKEQIASLEVQMMSSSKQSGFWNTLTSAFDKNSLKSEIRSYEKEVEQTENQLVAEFLAMDCSILQPEQQRYAAIQDRISELNTERSDLSKSSISMRQDIAKLEAELRDVKKELKEHQKRFYGLKDIV
ncbi:MAG: hypothetical protein RR588_11310 [Solibacillus sp.]